MSRRNRRQTRIVRNAATSASAKAATTWTVADDGKLIVGGIYFRDVRHPILVNGLSLLKLERNSKSGRLAVSFPIYGPDGKRIATVARNQIADFDDQYAMRSSTDRTALIEVSTGNVICEICAPAFDKDYELDVSFVTWISGDFPLSLHPNRTKIGQCSPDKTPNFLGGTLTGEKGTQAAAITVEGGDYYILDCAIENLAVGLRLMPAVDDGLKLGSLFWIKR